ncbi:MAG: hypothetical protein GY928_20770 [Colwellia sp.]|nr:hypothetical protein [Colwellia sp.]
MVGERKPSMLGIGDCCKMEGKPLTRYDFGGELGILVLERSCVKCGRFIKAGEVKLNPRLDLNAWNPVIDFIYKNWNCKRCGKTEPYNLGWF